MFLWGGHSGTSRGNQCTGIEIWAIESGKIELKAVFPECNPPAGQCALRSRVVVA